MSKGTKSTEKKDKLSYIKALHVKGNNVITKYTVPTSPGRIFNVKHRKEHCKNTSLTNASKASSSRNGRSIIIVSDSDSDSEILKGEATRQNLRRAKPPVLKHAKKTAKDMGSGTRVSTGGWTQKRVAPHGRDSRGLFTPTTQISDSPVSAKGFSSQSRLNLGESTPSQSSPSATPVLHPVTSTPTFGDVVQSLFKGRLVAQSTLKSSAFNTKPATKQMGATMHSPDPSKLVYKYTKMVSDQKNITPLKYGDETRSQKSFQSAPHKNKAGMSYPRLADTQEAQNGAENEFHHKAKYTNRHRVPQAYQSLMDISGRRQLHGMPRICSSEAGRPSSVICDNRMASADRLLQRLKDQESREGWKRHAAWEKSDKRIDGEHSEPKKILKNRPDPASSVTSQGTGLVKNPNVVKSHDLEEFSEGESVKSVTSNRGRRARGKHSVLDGEHSEPKETLKHGRDPASSVTSQGTRLVKKSNLVKSHDLEEFSQGESVKSATSNRGRRARGKHSMLDGEHSEPKEILKHRGDPASSVTSQGTGLVKKSNLVKSHDLEEFSQGESVISTSNRGRRARGKHSMLDGEHSDPKEILKHRGDSAYSVKSQVKKSNLVKSHDLEGLSQGGSVNTTTSATSNGSRKHLVLDQPIDEFGNEMAATSRKTNKVFTDVSNNRTNTDDHHQEIGRKTTKKGSICSRSSSIYSRSSSSNSSRSSPTFIPKRKRKNSFSSETSGFAAVFNLQDGLRDLLENLQDSDSENDPGSSKYEAANSEHPTNSTMPSQDCKFSNKNEPPAHNFGDLSQETDAKNSEDSELSPLKRWNISQRFRAIPSQPNAIVSPVLSGTSGTNVADFFPASSPQNSQSQSSKTVVDSSSALTSSSQTVAESSNERMTDESSEDKLTAKRTRNFLEAERDEKRMSTILDSVLSEAKKKSKEKRLGSLGFPMSRRSPFTGPTSSPLKHRSFRLTDQDHPLNRMLKSYSRNRKTLTVTGSEDGQPNNPKSTLTNNVTSSSGVVESGQIRPRYFDAPNNSTLTNNATSSSGVVEPGQSRPRYFDTPNKPVEQPSQIIHTEDVAPVLNMLRGEKSPSRSNSTVELSSPNASISSLSNSQHGKGSRQEEEVVEKMAVPTSLNESSLKDSATSASSQVDKITSSSSEAGPRSKVEEQMSKSEVDPNTESVTSRSKVMNWPRDIKFPKLTLKPVFTVTLKSSGNNFKASNVTRSGTVMSQSSTAGFKVNKATGSNSVMSQSKPNIISMQKVENPREISSVKLTEGDPKSRGEISHEPCSRNSESDVIDLASTDGDSDVTIVALAKLGHITQSSKNIISTLQDQSPRAVLGVDKPQGLINAVSEQSVSSTKDLTPTSLHNPEVTKSDQGSATDGETVPKPQANPDINVERNSVPSNLDPPRSRGEDLTSSSKDKQDDNGFESEQVLLTETRAEQVQTKTMQNYLKPSNGTNELSLDKQRQASTSSESDKVSTTSQIEIFDEIDDAMLPTDADMIDCSVMTILDDAWLDYSESDSIPAEEAAHDATALVMDTTDHGAAVSDESLTGHDSAATDQCSGDAFNQNTDTNEAIPSDLNSTNLRDNIFDVMQDDFLTAGDEAMRDDATNQDSVTTSKNIAARSDSPATERDYEATPSSDDLLASSIDQKNEHTSEFSEAEKQSSNLPDISVHVAGEEAAQSLKAIETKVQDSKADDTKDFETSMFDISQFFDDSDDSMHDELSDTEFEINDYLPEVLREDKISALRDNHSDGADDTETTMDEDLIDELPDPTARAKRRRLTDKEDTGQKTTLAQREEMMSRPLERIFAKRQSSPRESVTESAWIKEMDEIVSIDPSRTRNPRKRLRSTDQPSTLKAEPSLSEILADTAFSRSYKIHGHSLKKLVREKKKDAEVDKMEEMLLSDLKKNGGFRETLERAERGDQDSNIECDEDTKKAINLMKKDWGTLPILPFSGRIFRSKKLKYCVHKMELKSCFDVKSLEGLTARIRTVVMRLSAADISYQSGYVNFLLNQPKTRMQTYKWLLDVLHCYRNCDTVQDIIQSNLRLQRFNQSPFSYSQFKSALIDTGVSESLFDDDHDHQRTPEDVPEYSICEECSRRRQKTSARYVVSIAKVLSTVSHLHLGFLTESGQVETTVFLLLLLQERNIRRIDVMEIIGLLFKELTNWESQKYLIVRRLLEVCTRLNTLQSIAMRLHFNGERPHELSRILSFALFKVHIFGDEPQTMEMDDFNDLEALVDVVDYFNPDNLEILLVADESDGQIASQKRSYYHLSLLLPLLNICIGDTCEDDITFVALDRIWSILRSMNKSIRDNGAIYRSQVKYELSLFTKHLRVLIQKAPKKNKASIFKYLRSAPVKAEVVGNSIGQSSSSDESSDEIELSYNDENEEVTSQVPRSTKKMVVVAELDDEFRIADVIKKRIIGSAGKD